MGALGFDRLIGTTVKHQWRSLCPFCPEAGEMTPFGGTENLFHKFLKNAGFYLTTKILL